jgi:Domain of unknown function (DUF1996)
VNWYSDNTTLPASSCTSCEVQDDKSAYWTPQLYYAHSNGTFEEVPNYGMTVYFLGKEKIATWPFFKSDIEQHQRQRVTTPLS